MDGGKQEPIQPGLGGAISEDVKEGIGVFVNVGKEVTEGV